jgi:hypothetical protein
MIHLPVFNKVAAAIAGIKIIEVSSYFHTVLTIYNTFVRLSGVETYAFS